MGNSPTVPRRVKFAKKREAIEDQTSDECHKESGPKSKKDKVTELLQGVPLSDVIDGGCGCSFSGGESDSDDSAEGIWEEDDSDESDESMDNEEDGPDEEESESDEEENESDEEESESDEGSGDTDDSDESDGDDRPDDISHQQLPQQSPGDNLPPLSDLKPDSSDAESDDSYFLLGGPESMLNFEDILGSDDSAVSPSDCEADDWMPSCKQMADILYGIKQGEEGDAIFVKNVALILWDKEVLARSYVPGFEEVEEFTQFMPTRKPVCPKRLKILKNEYYRYKALGQWMRENFDNDKAEKDMAKIDGILADFIKSLNKPGGLTEDYHGDVSSSLFF